MPILLKNSSPDTELRLEIVTDVADHAGIRISCDGGRSEHFRDINIALRAYNKRLHGDVLKDSGMPWAPDAFKTNGKDSISAPVSGIKALAAEIRKEWDSLSDLASDLDRLSAPWDEVFDISDEEFEALGLPEHGKIIDLRPIGTNHDLILSLLRHPLEGLAAYGKRNRLVFCLASVADAQSQPESTEYFSDVSLAWRAFEQRLANGDTSPTRIGFQVATEHSRFEDRNAILSGDSVSISREAANRLTKTMLHYRLWDTSEALYYLLTDTVNATYGNSLVKWLGTVTVNPDGSGLYSKGKTRPFTMHIKVEIDPTDIEIHDDVIDFAYCHFSGHYDLEDWHAEGKEYRDLPYTDNGVEVSVNAFLKELGYEGGIDWSEHGRQEAGVADFDMDYELIPQFWPQLRPMIEAAAAKP